MQEDHHRDHALGVVQLGQVQTVVPQAMDREALGLGFFLKDKQQRLAAAIGPFEQQGHIQLAKAITKTLLQLLLTQRQDAHPFIKQRGFAGGGKLNGLAWIVEDEVFEVLVVAHRGSRFARQCQPSGDRRSWGESSRCGGLVASSDCTIPAKHEKPRPE